MKDKDRKKTLNNNQPRRPARALKPDTKHEPKDACLELSEGSCNEVVKEEKEEILVNHDQEKIEEMEKRIERLKEELREVAALEISLYSATAQHGSSIHKIHTPARRLSRFYMHASKHKTPKTAQNAVSGLVLVVRACGDDVSRLTYWLSNTIVLREIISQPLKMAEEGTKTSPDGFIEDREETRTFTAALEKIESWIFTTIVESVWCQTMMPIMQSPFEDLIASKSGGRLLGSDQNQGSSFCISLWEDAFKDAFHRLCTVRAGGHECGCLPVLSRMVMEQCVNRLDVAMFNAILRESAHQSPTDLVSDPIADTRVLPTPAGNLSFGSGAQLKNCVGNWCRWLDDSLGRERESYYLLNDDDCSDQSAENKSKWFPLVGELSDLLMLPKDLLLDGSIRQEVCPCISVALVKRVVCNFSPDEFCADDVPGEVLEALNLEQNGADGGFAARGFPYTAKAAEYSAPSSSVHSQLLLQRRGDELEDLDFSVVDIACFCNGNEASEAVNQQQLGQEVGCRFQLLREDWSG